jgi:hypothetical protein
MVESVTTMMSEIYLAESFCDCRVLSTTILLKSYLLILLLLILSGLILIDPDFTYYDTEDVDDF